MRSPRWRCFWNQWHTPVAEGAEGEAGVEVAVAAEVGEAKHDRAEARNRGRAAAEVLARNLRFLDRNRNQPAGRNRPAAIEVAEADARRSRAPVEGIVRNPRKGRAAEAASDRPVRAEVAEAALDCPASAVEEGARVIALRSVPTIGRIALVETIVRAEVIVPAEIAGQIVPVAAGTMILLVSLGVAAAARRGREVVVPVETIVLARVAVFAPVAIGRAPERFLRIVLEQAEVARNGAPAATIARVEAPVSCRLARVAEVVVSNGVPEAAAIVSQIVPAAGATERAGPTGDRIIGPSGHRAPSVRRSGRTSRIRATISGTSGSRRTTSTLTTSRRTG